MNLGAGHRASGRSPDLQTPFFGPGSVQLREAPELKVAEERREAREDGVFLLLNHGDHADAIGGS